MVGEALLFLSRAKSAMNLKHLFTVATVVLISALIVASLSRPSHKLSGSEVIRIKGAFGPESFAFDPAGEGPYTGVSDGRIIKWQENERRWIDFAVTAINRNGCEGPHDHELREHICGRPLGLHFNEMSGDLYIADAYHGLLVVGPHGGIATRLASEAQGTPFGFTNGVHIDQRTGVVFFTDSSSRYHRRDFMSVIVSGDKSGRLMKYEPETKTVTVLLDNIIFPNGVALSKDGQYLLLVETTTCKIIKFWVATSKAGTHEVFARLPGYPDNIKINSKGEFWVGIYAKRVKILEWIISYPWMGKALIQLPFPIMRLVKTIAKWRGTGLAVRLSEKGDILQMLEDSSWRSVSEANEKNGRLWIGSVLMPFAGVCKI